MYDTYVIKEGDNIDSISLKYNTSPEVLYQLNGYKFSLVPGNSLVVPRVSNDYFDYYSVSKGDTLYNIANSNKIDVKLLAQLNGIKEDDYIYQNQVLLIPKKNTTLYITAVGDTLNEVVNGFNVDLIDLVKQNDKIYLQSEQLLVYKHK